MLLGVGLPRVGVDHALLPLAQLLVLDAHVPPRRHPRRVVLHVDDEAVPVEQRLDGDPDLADCLRDEACGLLDLGVAVHHAIHRDRQQLGPFPQDRVRVRQRSGVDLRDQQPALVL